MKNRNKLEVLTVVILFIATSIIYGNGLHAQSLKKTFKYIKEGEIAKADIEVQEFTQDKKTSVEDLMLHGLSRCLIISNENYQNYNPYKSLELFKTTSEIIANKAEVDKFLDKYELTIDKVHEIIFQSIFSQAQKINTEASYEKALSVCEACSYKNEAIKLKETAAYNEAKNIKSVEGYKYFIGSYAKSEHLAEIKNLLYEAAFRNAKSELSLSRIKKYIHDYSNNDNINISIAINIMDSLAFSLVQKSNTLLDYEKYLLDYSSSNNKYQTLVINIRDSIVFHALNKNYTDYKTFIASYPHSKYTSNLKGELANILFDEATQKSSIKLFETFLVEFPNDKRRTTVLLILENLYFKKIAEKPAKQKIEFYKSRFPNCPNNKLLIELNKNDLTKSGVVGKVKLIKTTLDSYESHFELFNEDGNILIDSNSRNRTNYEYDNFGNLLSKVEIQHNWSYDGLAYDRNGNLIEHKFTLSGGLLEWNKYKYDEYYNLIEEIEFYEDGLSKSISKYSDCNKKIEYYSYDKTGNLLYGVRLDEKGRAINCDIFNSIGKLETKLPVMFNGRGNKTEEYIFDSIGVLRNRNFYKYDEGGKLIEKTEDEYNNIHDIWRTKRLIYEYDESNKLIKVYSSNDNGTNKLLLHKSFFYNEVDELLKTSIYEYTGYSNSVLFSINSYDSTGRRIEYAYYPDPSFKILNLEKVIYKYNDKNQIERMILCFSDGAEKTVNSKYDINGNIVRQYSYSDGIICKTIEERIHTESTYKYDSKNNVIEECNFYSDYVGIKHEYRYDDYGKMIEEKVFIYNYESHKLDEIKIYQCGKLNEISRFNPSGIIKYRYAVKRDSVGEIADISIFNSDGYAGKWSSMKFDVKGNRIEEIIGWHEFLRYKFNALGVIKEKLEYDETGRLNRKSVYNDNGFEIENAYYGGGKISSKSIFNERGLIISHVEFKEDGSLRNSVSYYYKFDDKGNWVEKKSNADYSISQRTIEFY